MSALRWSVPGGTPVLLDPCTRTDYRPTLMSWNESAPVEVRRASPDELARCGDVHRPARTNVKFPPRAPRPKGIYLAHLSDADILAAVTTAPNLDAAAAALHTSQASLSRRLRQIRAGVAA